MSGKEKNARRGRKGRKALEGNEEEDGNVRLFFAFRTRQKDQDWSSSSVICFSFPLSLCRLGVSRLEAGYQSFSLSFFRHST